jgi:multiple sugar transport system permease protein
VGARRFQTAVVGFALLLAAAFLVWQSARDAVAASLARERLASQAAAAVRFGLARGEGAAAAVGFGAAHRCRVRVLRGAEVPGPLLDSLRRDEAPRPTARGALAPLKDADDWDVVGAVEVTPLPGGEAARTIALMRPPVLLPLLGLGAAVAWLLAWAARTPERRRRETATAWAFLGIPFAHLALFSLLPVAFTVYLAFHSWDLIAREKVFIGLANFRELSGDGLFWRTLGNTALYVAYVPVTMAAAIGLAVLLNRGRGGERALRAIVFLPYVTSMVAIAIVWQWMFNADFGLVNYGLHLVGLPAVDWLGSPRVALLSIVAVTVWTQVGYQMVIVLAGLQGIPQAYYDAALVDGATPWQRFRHVTLPLLRPVILFVLVTGIIAGFQVFTLVYMMTEGGPLHSTDVIVYRIYQTAWEFLRFGYASAMSLVLFAILLVVTVVQFRLLGKRVEYV